ncbi:MAG: hypothetical protein B6242_06435 [Anaerolineaceae bacterium 4572_78]|nr:MAG: hypothetical protein B6242_06435 [Anaerolineaceae bacterium 4572_78]
MLEIRLNSIIYRGKNARQAYDTLYDNENISQLESFYMWAVDKFDLSPDSKFLDVACGKGELSHHVKSKTEHSFGEDLSPSAIKQGSFMFPDLPLYVANGQAIPHADNTFDVIGCMGSLEHYKDMAFGVREMARVVNPDGWVYILVPNTFSLLTNILVAYRKGRTSLDNQPIQRYAARLDWQDFLEDNGLIVKRTMKYERPFPRTWLDVKWYLYRPKDLFRLCVQPLVPLNLTFHFLFTCQKTTHRSTN